MGDYTIQKEASRIFHDVLLKDARLGLPAEVQAAASRTVIDAKTPIAKPFLPAPTKASETSTALWALLGTYGNAIVEQRFGVQQSVTVNSDVATLFIFAFMLTKFGDKDIGDPEIVPRYQRYDLHKQHVPWRRLCTNVYPTRDGRWFHLHGSLDATKSLQMLGLPAFDDEKDELKIIGQYCDNIRKYDANWLDLEANEYWRQSGCIALTKEEYLESEHGKIVANDPIYLVEASHADSLPAIPWPQVETKTFRPLEGIKILDLTRAIAGPTIARLAALFGATVVRISNDQLAELGAILVESNLGKRDANLDLKSDEGRRALLRLLEDADVILDGFRPGALDRLGFGPRYVHELARRRGKGIVYARENCYGWNGPLSHRSGWQMISDAVVGLSWEMGKFVGLDEPIVPPLPNADFQTGIIGCLGIMDALNRRAREGGNYLVSMSLNQYNSFLLSVGSQQQDIQDELREKWKDMNFRHYDNMNRILRKLLVPAFPKKVPELFSPAYFETISADWGKSEEEMAILRPAVEYETTKLVYDLGSSEKGFHQAAWP
ncbi:caib baif family protein [Seiridium cupressi]